MSTDHSVEEESVASEGAVITDDDIIDQLAMQLNKAKMSPICFVGEVNEENSAQIISSFIASHKAKLDKEVEDEEIEFFVNTEGGGAYEMFGIYDIMQHVKKDLDVKTIGIGKIMSAGVLLLAGGTKGKRFIGRNARVMIHNVISGQAGSINTIQNEFEEVKEIQDSYIDNLADCSNLSSKEIKKLLSKNQNIYLSAKKAIEYGFADQIL